MKPKRIISLVLAICLVAGLMPTVALASGTDTGKAIQLVDRGTAASISGYDNTDGYDYIYYGTWNGSPIKWRVLDDQTNTGENGLFLLSDVLLGTDVFFDNTDPFSNAWQGSTAQAWCKDFAGVTGAESNVADAFTTSELDAVLATTKSDTAFTKYISSIYSILFAASANILNGDKVFFLSAEEAENSAYGFINDDARVAYYGTSTCLWRLRSPSADGHDAGAVDTYGRVHESDVYGGDDFFSGRPAFNLDLNSVLFTSAAEGGKISTAASGGNQAGGAIFEISDYIGSEWKLTLLDKSRNFSVTETAATGVCGETITLNYTGATVYNAETAPNEYISVIIAGDSGAQYYGRIIQPTTEDGQIQITIPTSLSGGTYTLYAFSEQYNGGENDDTKLTDYASEFETVSLTVSKDTTISTHGWSDPDTYTLTVELNGGSGTVGDEFFEGKLFENEVIYIHAGSRSNYRFVSWTSSNGGRFRDAGIPSTSFVMPAADTTITANWEYIGDGGGANQEKYTISYAPGEYGTGNIEPGTKIPGENFTLTSETFTREGYVQSGWLYCYNDPLLGWTTKDCELGGIYSMDADVTLYPVWEESITVTVPITTTVKLGGNVAPGETTFALETFDSRGNEIIFDNGAVFSSVTTNGAGSYKAAMTFNASFGELSGKFNSEKDGYDTSYVFVRQVSVGEEGWTYDDTVWCLLLLQFMACDFTDDTGKDNFKLCVFPSKCKEKDDGSRHYYLDVDAGPLGEMSFTNTYTKTTTQPTELTEGNPGTGTSTIPPQTGDNSNLTLEFAMLVVSAVGVIATGVYSKRRRSTRAKSTK